MEPNFCVQFPEQDSKLHRLTMWFLWLRRIIKLQLHALLVVHVPAESFHGELYCFKVSK